MSDYPEVDAVVARHAACRDRLNEALAEIAELRSQNAALVAEVERMRPVFNAAQTLVASCSGETGEELNGVDWDDEHWLKLGDAVDAAKHTLSTTDAKAGEG